LEEGRGEGEGVLGYLFRCGWFGSRANREKNIFFNNIQSEIEGNNKEKEDRRIRVSLGGFDKQKT